MKALQTIVVVVLLVILAVVGIAITMPPEFAVEDTAMISAPADSLYARFVVPRTWARWSSWSTRKDPTLVYSYAGPDSGVGATMKWTSAKMGSGQFEIAEAQPGRLVRYELQMAGGLAVIHGRVTLEPAAGGTQVTWRDTGTLGKNPIVRLLYPLLGRQMHAAYEESFANLRRELQGS